MLGDAFSGTLGFSGGGCLGETSLLFSGEELGGFLSAMLFLDSTEKRIRRKNKINFNNSVLNE